MNDMTPGYKPNMCRCKHILTQRPHSGAFDDEISFKIGATQSVKHEGTFANWMEFYA